MTNVAQSDALVLLGVLDDFVVEGKLMPGVTGVVEDEDCAVDAGFELTVDEPVELCRLLKEVAEDALEDRLVVLDMVGVARDDDACLDEDATVDREVDPWELWAVFEEVAPLDEDLVDTVTLVEEALLLEVG